VLRYRVMAYVVGVLLIPLVAAWILELTTAEGTDAHELGANVTQYLGVAHGWLYMIFLITAAMLARAARFSLGFTVVVLLMGTVPVLSFVAEAKARHRALEVLAPVP
jgi:integral membrane protein